MRLFNFGGLFALLYLGYHYNKWTIQENSHNIISHILVLCIHKIPLSIKIILFLCLVIIFIWSIYTNKYSIIINILSSLMYQMIVKISCNTLMLEDISIFFLYEVVHPIPLELKLYHLKSNIFSLITSKTPQIIENNFMLVHLQTKLDSIIDINYLKSLNAKGIKDYACTLLNKYSDMYTQENQINMGAFVITGTIIFLHLLSHA